MMRARQLGVGLAAALAFGDGVSAQQRPTFQAGTDVIVVDVSVLDARGQPVRDLTAADFSVRLDGQPRRVVSAEWIPLTSRDAPRSTVTLPEGYTSNEQTTGGRLIVLAIDQPSIPFTAVRPLRDTLFRFIDGLEASDTLAVIGFGARAPSISFTTDRERARQAVTGMPGEQADSEGRHSIGLSTALVLERANIQVERDPCNPRCSMPALEQLVSRDCPPPEPTPGPRALCKNEIASEARDIVQNARQESETTIRALTALLTTFKGIDAPKTLILVSQRFFMDTERDSSARVAELGALAGAARTSVFGVSLEEEQFNIAQGIRSLAPIEDRRLKQQGLEILTTAARGALFNVTGTGTGVFDRIAAELSGYYLLGVEPDTDRDAARHTIDVDVSRRGTTVRSRRTMLTPAGTNTLARTPRDVATAALAEPFLLTGLPMRAVAFTLRGPDASKLQLLIHLEIGSGYTAPARLAVAYAVLDREGHAVDGQVTDSRLAPMTPGVPSPIEYVAGAGVAAGDYTVKLAAADDDRVGSLELPARAALIESGTTTLTTVMVGGPVPPGDLLRPTIGARIMFGTVQGYLEAYGADVAALTVTLEVAPGGGGSALLRADVPPRSAGADRAVFSQMVPVPTLPPGEYQLRAIVRKGDAELKTLTRGFEIAGSAGPASAPAKNLVTSDLAIAVDPKDLMPAFRRDAALRPETLAPFRARLSAAAGPAFDQGVSQMQKGAYADAETSFRRALQQDPQSTAALVYLAACLAAAGYDRQASAAWQTALARGSEVPQVYEWLGESLMRDRLFKDALDLIEEAVERFPTDPRFARSLALLYATTGRGRDALKTLKRYIDAVPDDPRAVFLAVQWLFNLHRANVVAVGRAEDLALARTYAGLYAKTSAPDQPLVKQWLDFLEKEAR